MTDIDAYNPEKWTSSANDALRIAIVSDKAVVFAPSFTYPIFGEHEQIFGFSDLKINLAFNATTMLPLLGTKYQKKLASSDAVKIEDPQEKMVSFLPESVVVNDESKWVEEYENELESFNIPGKLVSSYTVDGKQYDIYKAKLSDSKALELHKRVQIFVLLYIEAGSYIDASDEKWDYYFVYEKAEHSKFVGFTTVYNYWYYPGHEAFDSSDKWQIRKKISQFVILPPYQGKRHGANLYTNLVDLWMNDLQVAEIVVEDPSEAFDDLRDRCDLERLWNKGVFQDKALLKLPLTDERMTSLQKSQKMEKRQFARCIEMGLIHMDKLDKSVPKKGIRLQIKKRLYLKNKEVLDGMDKAERLDKLQGAYQSLVEDYSRVMEVVRFTSKRGADESDISSAKKVRV